MKKIEIFKNGEDSGYIKNNQNWWFDSSHPDSFELFDLDGFYSEKYFISDHVNENQVNNFYNSITEIYKKITGNDLKSVFEAGAGGGWFTKKLIDKGVDIIAIEGSKSGYEKSLHKGISPENIKHHDLRKPINMHKKFDICCCTEVAEHIETPFSSQLILTLITHSDLVWFSFEPPGTNDAHYHHCNEQPEKFWKNIFDFYGYSMIRIPNHISDNFSSRGTHIFYNRKNYNTLNIF